MTHDEKDLSARKTDHIDLTIGADVGYRKTTLLEQVELMHCSLPELSMDELSTETSLFGKRLRAPIMITGMTGGNERAGALNIQLAEVAERGGFAFGVGSQRPMVRDGDVNAEILKSYAVRKAAPNVLLFGNIGVVQARAMTTVQVQSMVDSIGADALCVHLNPAQEMIQSGGDRDFRGCIDTLVRLNRELRVPVIVKETGAGISGATAVRLRAMGLRHVDISGAGGTSWVAVEALRATGTQKSLGELFWDWGIPTGAALLQVRSSEFETVIASGGIQSGLCVARALALGATVAGLARPVLKALATGGVDGALDFMNALVLELRTAMLLTGTKRARDLCHAPRVYGPELARYAAPSTL